MWAARTLPVAFAALLALPSAASAVTRDQAVAAAVRGSHGTALVYATPAPLPAGSRVVEAGPGAWAVGPSRDGVTRLRPWRVRRAAWMVWQDFAPGAAFMHPGRLV